MSSSRIESLHVGVHLGCGADDAQPPFRTEVHRSSAGLNGDHDKPLLLRFCIHQIVQRAPRVWHSKGCLSQLRSMACDPVQKASRLQDTGYHFLGFEYAQLKINAKQKNGTVPLSDDVPFLHARDST